MSSNKTDKGTDSKSPDSNRRAAVVCVYSKGNGEEEQHSLDFFNNLGWQGWIAGSKEMNGFGPDQLGQLLLEYDQRFPWFPSF